MTARFTAIATVLLLTSWALAQPSTPPPASEHSMPAYMTDAERLLPLGSIQRSDPPPAPVTCPAEYEPCEGIFFAWEGYTDLLTAMTVTITTHDEETMVYMVVDTASEQTSTASTLSSAGADMDQVEFIVRATDTVWIRDYGPRFVFADGTRSIIDHNYNRPRPNDNALNDYIAELWDEPAYDIPLTHGGGNFHLFANGDAFMSTLILAENPAETEQSVKDLYAAYQGLDLTIYEGFPTSFDSTRHIDMWMLPVGDDKIIIGQYAPSDGAPYTITENAVADLESRGYTVYRTPGWRSGAHYTYTNAVIINDLVFMPTFNHANDAVALSVFQEAMPDHEIHQLDCSGIITAAGALHCIAMHVPARFALALTLTEEIPEFIPPGLPATVTVEITDGSEHYAEGSGQLHYRYDGGDWLTTALTPLGENVYEATLPAPTCGDSPEFYFTATGDGGTTIHLPTDAPATVYTTTVATLTTYLADDFETDQGWTVENDPSLTGGAWERAIPSTDGSYGEPTDDFDGSGYCFVTENTHHGDIDYGPTYLISPTLDLSAATDPILRYAFWFVCDDIAPPSQDYFVVEFSIDDGDTWIEDVIDPATDGWVHRDLHIADYATPTATTRIRFVASDNPNNSKTEAAIDAVWLFDVTCGPALCPGDTNCDGIVDFDDIDPFVEALGYPAGEGWPHACPWLNADCNNDANVTFDDIDPFVARIGATCP